MKIAYFSPISPQKSGISDYSEKEVLPFLSKYATIDLYVDNGVVPDNPETIKNFSIFSYKEIDKKIKEYDVILYHIGNNSLHIYMYETIQKHPGIVILHDIFLNGFVYGMTLAKGRKDKYIDEFTYCYGEKGTEIAKKAIQHGIYPEFEHTMIKRFIDNSIGVIVHSDYGKTIVSKEIPGTPIKKINMPLSIHDTNDNNIKFREKNDIGRDTIVVASFGYLHTHKRMKTILKAFYKFHKQCSDSKLMLIGEQPKYNDDEFNKLKETSKGVIIDTGFVPSDKLLEYLLVPDIFVNLRYPTAGETSMSALKIMGIGKPVIVSNVGWFSELPNDCCGKVNVDDYEEDILFEYLKVLAFDKKLRKRMGYNAKKFILKDHDPEKIAREYYMFINGAIGRQRKETYVIKDISEDMADIGIRETDDVIIKEVAIVLKELNII